MKTTSRTTRFLLAPLLAVSLSMGGLVSPVAGVARAVAQTLGECCRVEVAATCCGTACCKAPTRPDRSPADQPKRLDDRSNDGKLSWATAAFTSNSDPAKSGRQVFALVVPASGSPSLITQHIRLQL